ncbi:MAG: hypothetical protein EZS28_018558 [Streblomastix strix]|uniref:Uncharacterized protein n=1 Tax=Streblomastix strix TaxID=222440 RepID=A0A5J4VUB1_9EUKA|nr:MAG: hypothetical protein EZS28_018558 [Streblomastix strix]
MDGTNQNTIWVKVRLVPEDGKIRHAISVGVPNPHKPFLDASFISQLAIKFKMLPKTLKGQYTFLHQPHGCGKLEGVRVGPRDSFVSLELLNGAAFMFVHHSIIDSGEDDDDATVEDQNSKFTTPTGDYQSRTIQSGSSQKLPATHAESSKRLKQTPKAAKDESLSGDDEHVLSDDGSDPLKIKSPKNRKKKTNNLQSPPKSEEIKKLRSPSPTAPAKAASKSTDKLSPSRTAPISPPRQAQKSPQRDKEKEKERKAESEERKLEDESRINENESNKAEKGKKKKKKKKKKGKHDGDDEQGSDNEDNKPSSAQIVFQGKDLYGSGKKSKKMAKKVIANIEEDAIDQQIRAAQDEAERKRLQDLKEKQERDKKRKLAVEEQARQREERLRERRERKQKLSREKELQLQQEADQNQQQKEDDSESGDLDDEQEQQKKHERKKSEDKSAEQKKEKEFVSHYAPERNQMVKLYDQDGVKVEDKLYTASKLKHSLDNKEKSFVAVILNKADGGYEKKLEWVRIKAEIDDNERRKEEEKQRSEQAEIDAISNPRERELKQKELDRKREADAIKKQQQKEKKDREKREKLKEKRRKRKQRAKQLRQQKKEQLREEKRLKGEEISDDEEDEPEKEDDDDNDKDKDVDIDDEVISESADDEVEEYEKNLRALIKKTKKSKTGAEMIDEEQEVKENASVSSYQSGAQQQIEGEQKQESPFTLFPPKSVVIEPSYAYNQIVRDCMAEYQVIMDAVKVCSKFKVIDERKIMEQEKGWVSHIGKQKEQPDLPQHSPVLQTQSSSSRLSTSPFSKHKHLKDRKDLGNIYTPNRLTEDIVIQEEERRKKIRDSKSGLDDDVDGDV